MARATAESARTSALAIVDDLERARRNVAALGSAIHAAKLTMSPSLARAVQAQENLYERIDAEFGLLTSAQVAGRIGSRAAARRNAAAAAHGEGRLLALRRGRYLMFPAFQFDDSGPRPVIAELVRVSREHGWEETSLIEWLMAPTTYLAGRRPVDAIGEREKLLETARQAFGVSW